MSTNAYLWAVSLHIIAVICWMAGMFYLPRLYVYHAGLQPGSEASELFKTMERKLLRYIINPAMIMTWGFGLWLVKLNGWENLKTAGWFHVKLTLLVLMQICHALFARWRRDFAGDRNKHSVKFYRLVNEIPVLLMIVIVLMAVIKPF